MCIANYLHLFIKCLCDKIKLQVVFNYFPVADLMANFEKAEILLKLS